MRMTSHPSREKIPAHVRARPFWEVSGRIGRKVQLYFLVAANSRPPAEAVLRSKWNASLSDQRELMATKAFCVCDVVMFFVEVEEISDVRAFAVCEPSKFYVKTNSPEDGTILQTRPTADTQTGGAEPRGAPSIAQ